MKRIGGCSQGSCSIAPIVQEIAQNLHSVGNAMKVLEPHLKIKYQHWQELMSAMKQRKGVSNCSNHLLLNHTFSKSLNMVKRMGLR